MPPPRNTNCKLQIAAFLLLLLFTALTVPSAARAAIAPVEPASDDQGVYLLSEPGHLLWFRDTVNNVSADIDAKLTKDIDLSEGGGKPSEWIPVGQYTDKTPDGYAGSFDGGGFTVGGYTVTDVVSMDDSGILAAGFFGLVGQSADIRGLTVSGGVSYDISDNTTYIYAGGIAGLNNGTITDCANNGGGVSASGGSNENDAGGIAGYNNGTITNCAHSGGTVSASDGSYNYAGGIAGYNNNGTITNNTHSDSGDVSASGGSFINYAGGIVGQNYGGTITNNTHSGGDVSASSSSYNYAGGIAGLNNGGGTITNNAHSGSGVSAYGSSKENYAGGIAGHSNGTINNCTHSGSVSAYGGGSSNYAGGITGFNYYKNGTISNCANNRGTVSAFGGSYENNAGGIAGHNNGTMTNCANGNDTVSASDGTNTNAGGIAGINSDAIINCANDNGTVTASDGSSTNYAGGIAGYNPGGTITNCANDNDKISVPDGGNNCMGSLTGVNFGTITNSCWPASGDLEAIGGGIAVSADVVSLDAAEMERVVTTVLPAKRTLSVEVGGSAPALIFYPGKVVDMADYFSVSGDISVASPGLVDISRGWPCAVSGIKPGVTAVSFDIDLRGTDFSDKNNLKPLAASCVTGPLSFTAAVGKVPVSGVSLDFTELTLDIGESKKLTAAVKPDNATDKEVAWTSADPAVAAVDENGKVTALSAGTTVVTAKAGGVSAACTVTVAHKKTGGSGHGCAAGLGALPMLALIPLWLRRKKR
ncbi:Ig-like domain-containing protein [Cloacibacillus porcorum]|uniref:Ig-like domain-containing protein n=1 Tax=Cloacibacillus porcorum TaxID=1197717 RepID=UPI003F02DDA6